MSVLGSWHGKQFRVFGSLGAAGSEDEGSVLVCVQCGGLLGRQ